jgi:tRNA(His) 5'-end guanylyltransferase
MKQSLESSMREREVFGSLRLLPRTWCVIRLDGRAFTTFTAARFSKPFDEAFRDAMVEAAHALVEDFSSVYASTHSDEISAAFVPEWERFGRRLEKVVSVASGVVSAAFTHVVGDRAHFDARVWQAATENEVAEYFRWRQEDCTHCALHAWCYWTLCQSGLDGAAARHELEGKDRAEQNELLLRHGITFSELPAWQRNGVALYHETQEKTGYNPVTHANVTTLRRVVKHDLELPAGDEYESHALDVLRRARNEILAGQDAAE